MIVIIILLAKNFNIHKRMSMFKIKRLETLCSFADKNCNSI